MECQNENEYCIINLGTCLNIKSIFTQQEILTQAFSQHKPIKINGKQIIQIDAASLQLLLSFIIYVNENNLPWEWQEPSRSLFKIADLLGMRELLQLPK